MEKIIKKLIDVVRVSHLTNDEHYKYITEAVYLIEKFSAKALNVEKLFNNLKSLFKKEDDALKKVMKSHLTEEILAMDKRRGRLFKGMLACIKMALLHFDDNVVAAAKRLKILFDTYGNVTKKPMNQETSAIINLLQELYGKYAKDADLVGLTKWMKELEAENNAFDQLMRDRYEETALRTDLVLRECRQDVDDTYREIVYRINAYITIEGDEEYSEFVHRLNIIIAKYNAALAQRYGAKRKAIVSGEIAVDDAEAA
jgi:hypothetical protein